MRILLSIIVVAGGLVPALPGDTTNARSVSSWIKQLNSPQVKLRQEAAEALAKLGPAAASAVPALIKALEDWRVREPASKALVRIGPKALPALRQALAHDSPLAPIALDIISRMGRKAVPYLMTLLKEKRGEAHHNAILVTGKLKQLVLQGDLQAARILAEMGPTDPDLVAAFLRVKVEVSYYASLAEKVPKVVPALIQRLQEEDHHQAAAVTLGRIGPAAAAAVPELIEALKYPEYHRLAAIQALGRIGAGSDKVLPCLLKL